MKQKIIGWATISETEASGHMFWPTREEALTYCEDGEQPIALVAQQTQHPVNVGLLDSLREVVAYCEESGIDWMCLITAHTEIDAAEAAVAAERTA